MSVSKYVIVSNCVIVMSDLSARGSWFVMTVSALTGTVTGALNMAVSFLWTVSSLKTFFWWHIRFSILTPWPSSQNLDQVFHHYLFYTCKSSSVSQYIVSIIVDNVNVIIIT